LLPATMKLLGDWNWYLPRWLQWLPRFDVSESEAPAETEPAAAPAPATSAAASRRRRSGRPLVLAVVGALLLGVGVLGILHASGTYDAALAAVLVVAGGTIGLGAIVGRRVARLLPFGIVLVAVSAVAALSPVNLSAGIGEREERPLDTAQLDGSYEFGIGDFTLDLSEVALPPGTTRVDVELGIGNLLIRLPEEAALEIDGHASGGQVTVLGETDDGSDADERAVVPGSTSDAPVLELDADIGFGHLDVRRG
jgi:Cell wall-active antibiotics response 4TMS YvqF